MTRALKEKSAMDSGRQPLRGSREKTRRAAATQSLTRPGADRLRVHFSRIHDVTVDKPRMGDLWNLAGIFGGVVARNPFRLCNTCHISRTAESSSVGSSQSQATYLEVVRSSLWQDTLRKRESVSKKHVKSLEKTDLIVGDTGPAKQ